MTVGEQPMDANFMVQLCGFAGYVHQRLLVVVVGVVGCHVRNVRWTRGLDWCRGSPLSCVSFGATRVGPAIASWPAGCTTRRRRWRRRRGGDRLPSLAVTLAYVRACGGDTAEWETRWRAVAEELDPSPTCGTDDATTDDGPAPYVGLTCFEPEDSDRFFGRHEGCRFHPVGHRRRTRRSPNVDSR